MIPHNIVQTDLLKALEWLEINGLPDSAEPEEPHIIFKDRVYPVSHLIAVANKFANDEILNPARLRLFPAQLTQFVQQLGFEVTAPPEPA